MGIWERAKRGPLLKKMEVRLTPIRSKWFKPFPTKGSADRTFPIPAQVPLPPEPPVLPKLPGHCLCPC